MCWLSCADKFYISYKIPLELNGKDKFTLCMMKLAADALIIE